MKRLLLVLTFGFGVSYAFIPFVASDTLLKLYPLPHSVTISPLVCTLNILQDTIQLVVDYYGVVFPPPSMDPLLKEAAKVCSTEIDKAFFYAIGHDKPIKIIKIDSLWYFPPRPGPPQDVQVIFIFGTKGDGLVSAALESLQVDGLQVTENDIPDSSEEGYLLAGTASKSKNRLLVLCAGKTNIGCFRGASTLRELIAQNCPGVLPTSFKISDWPDCPWREASWANLEVGCDTTKPSDMALRLAQLDYFSLMKVAQVDHVHHKFYFQDTTGLLKTPSGSDEDKIGDIQRNYNWNMTHNNLPSFWYPKNRHRGIEPIPLIFNFQPIYHIGVWNPNTFAGTFDSLRFVVDDTMLATPIYKVPPLQNPCFDDTSQHTFPNPTMGSQYKWWFVEDTINPIGFARWDKNNKKYGAASMRLVCDPGEYITMLQDTACFEGQYIFAYYIKTCSSFYHQKATAKIYAAARLTGTTDWYRIVSSAFGPQNKTKWNCVIDTTIPDWKDFSVGIHTKGCDRVAFYVTFSVPDTATAPCTLWVEGDPCMNNVGSLTAHYTQQQRFLIQTPTGKERVWRDGQPVDTSQYSIDYRGLSYDYGNGCINTADTGRPNENFRLKMNVPISGDTISMAYNHITGGFFYADFKPSSRCNYASPTVDSITALYDSTGIELVRNNLHPPFIDHNYNEVAQNSLDRDGRVKIKGWTKSKVLAEDIHYNLRHTQKTNAYDGRKPIMTLLADALLPQHQGEETWEAIQIIRNEYPQDTAYIIPKTWGSNNMATYQALRNSICSEADTLRKYGFTLVLNPQCGKYNWWLGTLAYLKENTNFKPKGFAWTSDTAPAWTARDFRGDTVNFAYLPLSMDLAWNLNSSRFKWSGGEPDSVLVNYSPNTLHLNKGDIFSPPVANFNVQRIGPNKDSVELTWFPNLNKDFWMYRIDRWNGTTWETTWTRGVITEYDSIVCIDPTPIWVPDTGSANGMDSIGRMVWFAGWYARYRISAFDDTTNNKIPNQSLYDTAEVRKPLMIKLPWATAYPGQKKIINSGTVFHLTWTGGMVDTVICFQSLIANDTVVNPAETLAVGKFPTLVVKLGDGRDTVGLAFLSKHSDTIYYRCRSGTLWDAPVVLYSATLFSLSVPRMALDTSDTVHITFAKKNIRGDTLTLNYGKFSLTDPAYLAVQPINRWTPANPSGSIDSLGAAVVIDFLKRPYLAWIENDTIKYAIGLAGGFLKKTLSASAGTKRSVYASASPFNIEIDWTDGDNLIRSYWYVGDTAEIFRDTVYSGSEPKNATGKGSFVTFEQANDVFVKLWDPVNRTWSSPETLSTDTLPASYPQIEAEQFIDSTDTTYPARFVLWTKMNEDSLYELGSDIRNYENAGEYGITPYAYLKMGKVSPTPFTVHRDGFHSFGSEDYKQIDFGQDSLVYLLPFLESSGKYRMFTEFYFDTTAPNGYKAKLTVNGITIRNSITITSRQLLRLNDILPANIPAMGYLRIKLTNQQGIYVPCSRIIVTRFKDD
jgi:hypothetical protein